MLINCNKLISTWLISIPFPGPLSTSTGSPPTLRLRPQVPGWFVFDPCLSCSTLVQKLYCLTVFLGNTRALVMNQITNQIFILGLLFPLSQSKFKNDVIKNRLIWDILGGSLLSYSKNVNVIKKTLLFPVFLSFSNFGLYGAWKPDPLFGFF